MTRIRALLSLVLLSAMACGGSSTGPDNGTNNSAGPMSATIDGKAWSSPFPTATYHNTIVAVAGLDLGITASVSFAFVASAPGTFSVGNGNNVFGSAVVAEAGKGWGTAFPGGTGTVTLTTLTSTRVAGTFAFDAVANNGGATGTVHVTNGKFDITF
jgi:hypothetical protein